MEKAVIIKLGADGDVLRTIPLAKALKKEHPSLHLTWITRGDVATILEKIPYIDRVLKVPYKSSEKFDLLYNFDVDKEATQLASQISATKKYGFYEEGGYPAAFNRGSEYYLNTLFDDYLKKTNARTYQEMMFEVAELRYKVEPYKLTLDKKSQQYGKDFFEKHNLLQKKIIGVHMGASSRWPSKVWHESNLKEFIIKAIKSGYEILLFGGPNEIEGHKLFAQKLAKEGHKVHQNNPHNSKLEFAALVSHCDYIVCSDSLALHVSTGVGRKTVALFFCTSPNEVEDYGLITKLVSPFLKDFFPERSNEYNEKLVKSISADEVLRAIPRRKNNNNK